MGEREEEEKKEEVLYSELGHDIGARGTVVTDRQIVQAVSGSDCCA